ncbi:unnamed protein product, partial [Allacma fusca]
MRSANVKPFSLKSTHFKTSILKSSNVKSSLKSDNLIPSNCLTSDSPKASSQDSKGSSEDEDGNKSGGKTSKTDVILVHVIRKKLKVKSSGQDPCQSNSASGSSDSGSDTTEGNPEHANLHDNHGLSQCHSKAIKYTTTNSFVKKNNIKNQSYHQVNGQVPINNTLSVASQGSPTNVAFIANPTNVPASTATPTIITSSNAPTISGAINPHVSSPLTSKILASALDTEEIAS